MNSIKSTLAALLLTTGLAGAALAGTVTGISPYAVESFGQQSDQGSSAYAQTFSTPTGTILEAIQWWGFHGIDSGGASFDNFEVRLDGSVQSGALTSVAVMAADGSYLYDLYTLDVTDTLLTATALSILNDSSDVEWYWQSASATGNPLLASASDVAFRLLGHAAVADLALPEPGSFALTLLALAGLSGLRKRLRA